MNLVTYVTIEIVDEATDTPQISYVARSPSEKEEIVATLRTMASMLESGELGVLPSEKLH